MRQNAFGEGNYPVQLQELKVPFSSSRGSGCILRRSRSVHTTQTVLVCEREVKGSEGQPPSKISGYDLAEDPINLTIPDRHARTRTNNISLQYEH